MWRWYQPLPLYLIQTLPHLKFLVSTVTVTLKQELIVFIDLKVLTVLFKPQMKIYKVHIAQASSSLRALTQESEAAFLQTVL